MSAEIKVTATKRKHPTGRVQQAVLDALQGGHALTTAELAETIHGHAGVVELNTINRALGQLAKRGIAFAKTRKGRVGASGYIHMWRLA